MAYGTKNFEEAQSISVREKFAALSTPGVAKATPLIATFTEWRKPTGGSTIVVLIGADHEDGGLSPWNIIEGDVSGLGARDAVIVEKSYLSRPRPDRRRRHRADRPHRGCASPASPKASARSRVTPYVFTTLNRARTLLDMPADKMTYVLVKLEPGADAMAVRNEIRKKRARQRGADQGRVPRPQPQPLAVCDRRRRGADRRRHPRPHRRHRDRGADALFQHQGPPERVRHAARARAPRRATSTG